MVQQDRSIGKIIFLCRNDLLDLVGAIMLCCLLLVGSASATVGGRQRVKLASALAASRESFNLFCIQSTYASTV